MKRIAKQLETLTQSIVARGKIACAGLVAMASVTMLVSCGEGQNLNQFLIAGNEDKAVDHLVDRANYHFDKGELQLASEYADKALAINPTNEEVVLTKGYISLSEAGVGIFQLSKKLIDLGDDTEGAASLLFHAEDSSTDASAFLSKMGTLIGDEDELDKIKGDEVIGTGLFQNLNYQPPLPADESRRKEVTVIDKTNEALSTICPLVAVEAKVLETDTAFGDLRHETDGCAQSSRPTQSLARVHFIWALSHLMEATAFNLVLVPALNTLESQATAASTEPGETANNQTVTIEKSIAAFTTLADAIEDILPSGADAQNSMLNGMLNDLDATARGFAQIPGIPPEMGETIGNAIAGFRAKQNQFASAGKNAGASSLKDQLLGTVTSKLSDYIKNPPADMTDADKEQACDALASFSGPELASLQELNACPE